MNFIEAIKKMQNGERVRLPHWRTSSHIKKDDSTDSGYILCLGQRCQYYQFKELEMLSDDWEIYREEPKLHTFKEAIDALILGKKIRRKYKDHREYYKRRDWLFNLEDILANDWIIEERDQND